MTKRTPETKRKQETKRKRKRKGTKSKRKTKTKRKAKAVWDPVCASRVLLDNRAKIIKNLATHSNQIGVSFFEIGDPSIVKK